MQSSVTSTIMSLTLSGPFFICPKCEVLLLELACHFATPDKLL